MKANLQRFAAVVLAGTFLGACDYTGDWLFGQPIDGLPAIYQIEGPDGGPIVPADVSDIDSINEATIYGEVATSQTAELGGVTAEFVGTGGSVCIWVDPEAVAWTQAVATNGAEKFTYPDNVWDDGDLDLRVGLSVYYTGSPERLGDFQVTYEDDLGNPVEIQLQDCPNEPVNRLFADFVDAGKGSPERCTIDRTEPGVSYTIVLRSWSTPIDDDRLGYGLLVANGPCSSVEFAAGRNEQGAGANLLNAECVLVGEAIRPLELGGPEDGSEYQPMFGLSAVEEAGATFPSFRDLEELYCNPGAVLRDFCRPEARQVIDNGQACLWDGFEEDESEPLEKVKCFCGDPDDTPGNGPG